MVNPFAEVLEWLMVTTSTPWSVASARIGMKGLPWRYAALHRWDIDFIAALSRAFGVGEPEIKRKLVELGAERKLHYARPRREEEPVEYVGEWINVTTKGNDIEATEWKVRRERLARLLGGE